MKAEVAYQTDARAFIIGDIGYLLVVCDQISFGAYDTVFAHC